jgi:hypothetical protein
MAAGAPDIYWIVVVGGNEVEDIFTDSSGITSVIGLRVPLALPLTQLLAARCRHCGMVYGLWYRSQRWAAAQATVIWPDNDEQ